MNGTFCYLSTILDACTKQVLSHVLSESLEVDFVLDTVEQLVERHGVSLNKEKLTDQNREITADDLIDGKYLLAQKGKKNYYLLIVK